MKCPRYSAIVAHDQKRGIGKSGAMPWYLPEDLKRFKKLTLGHPMIMGRKTFDSIIALRGAPLPGRVHIVISRSFAYDHPAVKVVRSVDAAIDYVEESELCQEVFVIGGGEIFKQFLPMIDRLYVTKIEKEYDADTFFPKYPGFGHIIDREDHLDSTPPYSFLTLER